MLRFGVLSVAALFFITAVHGYSNGENVLCDTEQAIGSDPVYDNPRLGEKTGKAMWWVLPPRHVDSHTLRSGDGDVAADPTTYTPGGWQPIYIRVLDRKLKYSGLLMYAVDEEENKVGEWDIDPDRPYWLPTKAGCDGKAVMHSDGMPKHFVEVFHFRLPSNSSYTGKIVFRCLLKYGLAFPALDGLFVWPNAQKPMELTYEAPSAPTSVSWEEGKLGQSCDDVCSALAKSCDSAHFDDAASAALLLETVSSSVVCNMPVMQGASPLAPVKGSQGCWFAAESSEGQGNNRCGAKSSREEDGLRICPCGPYVDPSSVSGAPPKSSSPAPVLLVGLLGSWLLSSLCFPGGFSQQQQQAVKGRSRSSMLLLSTAVLIMMCSSLPTASAHNWLRSPRARENMAAFSCRASTDVHVQVAAGQKFQHEWTTGHGGFAWVVIMKAEDERFIGQNTDEVLEDYLQNAPNTDYYKDEVKYHVKTGLTGDPDGDTDYSRFVGVETGVERGPTFGPRRRVDQNHTLLIYPEDEGKIPSANYANPKYPWLISVHKQMITFGNAFETDLMLLQVPEGNLPGKYIAFWKWRGYIDCFNINVLDKQSTDVHGTQLATDAFQKIDHCTFEEGRIGNRDVTYGYPHCFEVKAGDPLPAEVFEYCLNTRQCKGVQLSPLSIAEDLAFPYSEAYKQATENCEPLESMDATSSVAFSLTSTYLANTNQDALTDITNDALDEPFFSTCWRRVKKYSFKDDCPACVPPPPFSPFKFGRKCISCEDAEKYSTADPNTVARHWKTTDTCTHCWNEKWGKTP